MVNVMYRQMLSKEISVVKIQSIGCQVSSLMMSGTVRFLLVQQCVSVSSKTLKFCARRWEYSVTKQNL